MLVFAIKKFFQKSKVFYLRFYETDGRPPKDLFKLFWTQKLLASSKKKKKVFEPLRGFIEKGLCNCASYIALTFTNASS